MNVYSYELSEERVLQARPNLLYSLICGIITIVFLLFSRTSIGHFLFFGYALTLILTIFFFKRYRDVYSYRRLTEGKQIVLGSDLILPAFSRQKEIGFTESLSNLADENQYAIKVLSDINKVVIFRRDNTGKLDQKAVGIIEEFFFKNPDAYDQFLNDFFNSIEKHKS